LQFECTARWQPWYFSLQRLVGSDCLDLGNQKNLIVTVKVSLWKTDEIYNISSLDLSQQCQRLLLDDGSVGSQVLGQKNTGDSSYFVDQSVAVEQIAADGSIVFNYPSKIAAVTSGTVTAYALNYLKDEVDCVECDGLLWRLKGSTCTEAKAAVASHCDYETPVKHLREMIDIAMGADTVMVFTNYAGEKRHLSTCPIGKQLRNWNKNGVDVEDRDLLVNLLLGLQEYVLEERASAWKSKPAWAAVTKLLTTLLQSADDLPDKQAAAVAKAAHNKAQHLKKSTKRALEAGDAKGKKAKNAKQKR
jgi:hypothetical protein